MKKTIAIITALLLVIATLVSCSGTATDKPGNTQDSNAETLEGTPSTPFEMRISDANVTVGDTFSVFINLDADGWTWDSFELVVKYNPDVIKITEIKSTELTAEMLNITNLKYAKDKVKLAFASANELEGGGDIAEIVCEAIAAGTFDMEPSEPFASREVTIKASNEKKVVDITSVSAKKGIVTVTEAESKKAPLFSIKDTEAAVGDTFSVFVNLADIEQWDSFELVISYDGKIVEFVEAKTTALTENMLNMTTSNEKKYEVKLAFASAEEITETGDVVELVFTAKAAGKCKLALSSPYMSVEINGSVEDVEGVLTENSVITVK